VAKNATSLQQNMIYTVTCSCCDGNLISRIAGDVVDAFRCVDYRETKDFEVFSQRGI